MLAERTADLQRLQAEYVNYKRRVDRDREVARDMAKVSVLTALLPVLDDIGRAREHGELTGGFKAVAESLERVVTGLGLVPFGEVGEAFDPHRHEALMHSYSDEVSGPRCQAILQVGYQFGERVVRPARVAVAEPTEVVTAESEAASTARTVPTDSGVGFDSEAGSGTDET
ncbi:MAG: nucleotide exchange factor GrpE, partial [Nocardioidaceae bacterium]|nr:nucleotide exchange factor GrpE [Nocardioidaceae bacterium]